MPGAVISWIIPGPLAVSLLAVLMTYPGLAAGAEALMDDVLSPTVFRESVTPEQELLGRIEAMDSVRIVLHSRKSAKRLADQLGSLLAALGATRVERRIVDAVPEINQIRYYHPADREAGQVVGEALSLVLNEVIVRNFTGYLPAPAEGLIEIWLR